MKKLKFVVSLTTNDNDYQMEQSVSAQEAAKRLNADIQVIYADNDSIAQSQQLLKIIQSDANSHPDGILLEPVGATALPQVALAAARAGIGWGILNRDVDYISDLRKSFRIPAFCISSDHLEIGRIQGRQFAALLPKGGAVLYIQGPSENSASKERSAGMYETKPSNVEVKLLRGNWTEASAHKAVTAWLRLSTSQRTHMDLIAAQDDSMAVGAKKAFQEIADNKLRDHWLGIPYIGVDGLPKTGQAWVRRGLLTATIVVPPNSGKALELMVRALQSGTLPPERSSHPSHSFPALDALGVAQAEKVHIFSR
ncbi:MAG: inositol transport system substrate-binding protein [Acidobacteriaceae bacterium]